ncbi:hypothetical protein RJT34_33144 [Clitoria ternatea]|uniref:BOD1/SHG1 domain-containing protein n=1 Tax=Clitoria ternatea TaxID=43366 RepID=A0AAN9I585_CLITE
MQRLIPLSSIHLHLIHSLFHDLIIYYRLPCFVSPHTAPLLTRIITGIQYCCCLGGEESRKKALSVELVILRGRNVMGSGGEVVGKEEVIAKLKDDGDFDRLRFKIVRKLKDNEDLRQHITSIVKQSVALNRAGAENMKPRQLSDAIYEEVGDKVMSQISDSLWQIIRSNDGMKSEIMETVQSVYDKLANPKGKDEVVVPVSDVIPVQRQGETASATGIDDTLHENEPTEPPGFTLAHNHLNNNNHEDPDKGQVQVQRQGFSAEQKEDSHPSQDMLAENDGNAPPGFSMDAERNPPSDCSDDDPDVPPGFAVVATATTVALAPSSTAATCLCCLTSSLQLMSSPQSPLPL